MECIKDKAFFAESDSFTALVEANDNREKWAVSELNRMFQDDVDGSLIEKTHRARAVIYEKAALNGDRDAILKYARGLEWSGNKEKALEFYNKLISEGDTVAMIELANDYTEYGGMGRNDGERLRLIKQAMSLGSDEARLIYEEIAASGV